MFVLCLIWLYCVAACIGAEGRLTITEISQIKKHIAHSSVKRHIQPHTPYTHLESSSNCMQAVLREDIALNACSQAKPAVMGNMNGNSEVDSKRDVIRRKRHRKKLKTKKGKENRKAKKTEMVIVDESQLDDDGNEEEDEENFDNDSPRSSYEYTDVTGDRKAVVNRLMGDIFSDSGFTMIPSRPKIYDENDDLIAESLKEGLNMPYLEGSQLIKTNQLRGNYFPVNTKNNPLLQPNVIESPVETVVKDTETAREMPNAVKKASSRTQIDAAVRAQILEDIAKDEALRNQYPLNITLGDLVAKSKYEYETPKKVAAFSNTVAAKATSPENMIDMSISKQINEDLMKDFLLSRVYSDVKNHKVDGELKQTVDLMNKNPDFINTELKAALYGKKSEKGTKDDKLNEYSYLKLPENPVANNLTSVESEQPVNNASDGTVGDFANIVEEASAKIQKASDAQQGDRDTKNLFIESRPDANDNAIADEKSKEDVGGDLLPPNSHFEKFGEEIFRKPPNMYMARQAFTGIMSPDRDASSDVGKKQTEFMMPMKADIADRTVAPSEQLLEMLSKGRFNKPLSEAELTRLSNFDANKLYIQENHLNSRPLEQSRFAQVGSQFLPVQNVGVDLNRPSESPFITNKQFEKASKLARTDPAFLGQNIHLLDGSKFHTLDDLNSISEGVIQAHVVNVKAPATQTHAEPPRIIQPARMFEDALVPSNTVEKSDETKHPIEEPQESACHINPCQNGGQCTSHPSGYRCSCKTGWIGENCQRRSSCTPNPCHHGVCSPNADGHTCTCKVGYKGSQCDIVDRCHPNPCVNNGICTEANHKVQCECQPGFKGSLCELESKCTPINPCLNGGTCREYFSRYHCICSSHYHGQNCEDILSPTKIPITAAPILQGPQVIPTPANLPSIPSFSMRADGTMYKVHDDSFQSTSASSNIDPVSERAVNAAGVVTPHDDDRPSKVVSPVEKPSLTPPKEDDIEQLPSIQMEKRPVAMQKHGENEYEESEKTSEQSEAKPKLNENDDTSLNKILSPEEVESKAKDMHNAGVIISPEEIENKLKTINEELEPKKNEEPNPIDSGSPKERNDDSKTGSDDIGKFKEDDKKGSKSESNLLISGDVKDNHQDDLKGESFNNAHKLQASKDSNGDNHNSTSDVKDVDTTPSKANKEDSKEFEKMTSKEKNESEPIAKDADEVTLYNRKENESQSEKVSTKESESVSLNTSEKVTTEPRDDSVSLKESNQSTSLDDTVGDKSAASEDKKSPMESESSPNASKNDERENNRLKEALMKNSSEDKTFNEAQSKEKYAESSKGESRVSETSMDKKASQMSEINAFKHREKTYPADESRFYDYISSTRYQNNVPVEASSPSSERKFAQSDHWTDPLSNPHPMSDVDNDRLLADIRHRTFDENGISYRKYEQTYAAKPQKKITQMGAERSIVIRDKNLLLNKLNRNRVLQASLNNKLKLAIKQKPPFVGKMALGCPGFCRLFCDPWCMKVGCCRTTPEQIKIFKQIETAHVTRFLANKNKVCARCNENADCINNRCVCKTGFHGNGISCAVDNCLLCHLDADCANGRCVCKHGFYGDGYECKPVADEKVTCPVCHHNAKCIKGNCFCVRGFFGNGKGCWPLPIT